MIFVVGGNNQGKLDCAREMFGEDYVYVNHYHEMVRQQLQHVSSKMKIELDKTGIESVENIPPLDVAMQAAKQLLQEKKDNGEFERLVIISDELGCGLVPVDAFEREYREVNGRVNCYLAKEADTVVRVVCGIANIIKGNHA